MTPALALVLTMAAGPTQAGSTAQADLLRRLEEAEARIRALEQLVREQSGQLGALRSEMSRVPPAELGLAATTQAPKTPGAVEAPPERPITHQLVSLRFNGLVQAWYAAGNRGLADTFRIRRSELLFTGEITNKARWQVMVDPAKALSVDTTTGQVNQASRILQNAVVTFAYDPRMQVNVGQLKLPLSREGQMSSGRLDTIERALFASDRARGGSYGDVRDIGLLVRGGFRGRLDYQLGVFNGVAETQNDVDGNDQKALAGSLAARLGRGAAVGVSGAWGNGGGPRPRRDRLGAELEIARGPLMLRSEVMVGHDGPLSRRGFYGHAGYRFITRLEAVLRVDGWDPDTDRESTTAGVSELDYVAGLNVFLSQHNLKLQVNYLRKTFGGELLPSRNVFLVNTQTFW